MRAQPLYAARFTSSIQEMTVRKNALTGRDEGVRDRRETVIFHFGPLPGLRLRPDAGSRKPEAGSRKLEAGS
jgi:hypothetical protein